MKQFEITLQHGQGSKPIEFDKAGLAAIGCNIHDHMIAYAFVSDTPWAQLSKDDGRVTFSDVPEGAYVLKVWHPRLLPGVAPAPQNIRIASKTSTVRVAIRVAKPVASRMHHGDY